MLWMVGHKAYDSHADQFPETKYEQWQPIMEEIQLVIIVQSKLTYSNWRKVHIWVCQ